MSRVLGAVDTRGGRDAVTGCLTALKTPASTVASGDWKTSTAVAGCLRRTGGKSRCGDAPVTAKQQVDSRIRPDTTISLIGRTAA
jgi:hypothetical protein